MVLAGTLLGGRYELDESVGSGGFSEVWRAKDTVLSRPVAVKLLRPAYADHAEALARFRAEARNAAALSHQNVARVYDYHEPDDQDQPYLVMEFVDGPSLADVLADGPLSVTQTMDVIAQAAAGLDAAHASGLTHRDIKPGNLLLGPGGAVKITDFGIAHAVGAAPVTVTGMLVGTPSYMAPERVAGAQATPASDLYALGIVGYECLAGTRPFVGVPLEVAMAHRDRPLPPLPVWVPAEAGRFVMQLTAKDPAARPGSAAEVAWRAGQLRDGLSDAQRRPQPVQAAALAAAGDQQRRPVPVTSRGRVPAARRRRLAPALATAALAAVVLAALLGVALAHMTSFPSAQHPLGVPPAARPAAPAGNVAAAQRLSKPATSPGPVGGVSLQAAADQVTIPRRGPGPGKPRGPGHRQGNRPGDSGIRPGKGKGGGKPRGDHNGGGQGNGGQGNGNGDDDGSGPALAAAAPA